jgi:hypothetical protein
VCLTLFSAHAIPTLIHGRSSLPLLTRGAGLLGSRRSKSPQPHDAGGVFGAVAKGLSNALGRARGRRPAVATQEPAPGEEGATPMGRRFVVTPLLHLPASEPRMAC